MKDLRGYLYPEEVEKIISSAKNPRDKLLLRLLWVTGCRISELVGEIIKKTVGEKVESKVVARGLHVSNIDFRDGVVILETLKRKKPHGRRVPIDIETQRMLENYISGYEIKGKLFNITRQRVYQILRETGKKAGIVKVGDNKLHPHHLRHSHCVAWVRADPTMEGLRKLQRRVGHASIATTALYLQFAESGEDVEKVFGGKKE